MPLEELSRWNSGRIVMVQGSTGNAGLRKAFQTVHGEKFRWVVRREWGTLPEKAEAALRTLLTEPGGKIKDIRGIHRSSHMFKVARGEGECRVFLKIFFEKGWEKASAWLHLSRGWREWRGGQALEERGIPSPLLLGFGRGTAEWGRGLFVVAMEGVPESIPLDSFLEKMRWVTGGPLSPIEGEAHGTQKDRAAFVESFALFIRDMHDKGVFHKDLHPGNILLKIGGQVTHFFQQEIEGQVTHFHRKRLESTGQLRSYGNGNELPVPLFSTPEFRNELSVPLFLIDFHALRCRGALAWKKRTENLALLNLYFFRRSSRADRLRFLRAYLSPGKEEEAQGGKEFLFQIGQRVESLTRQMAQQFWRKREKRCLGYNRYFQKVHAGNLTGFAVNRDLPRKILGLLPYFAKREKRESIDAGKVPEEMALEILKDSRTASSFFLREGGREYFLKVFHWKKLWNPIFDLFRGSRAKRAWKKAHGLMWRGIPTAPPVFFLEQKAFGFPLRGILLFEKLAGFTSLSLAASQLAKTPAMRSEWRAIVSRIGALIRVLHEEGFGHRDLKTSNLMIQLGNSGRVSLIDLDGMHFDGRVVKSIRIRDLTRLYRSAWNDGIGASDCVRFLKVYLGRKFPLEGKFYWHSIGSALPEGRKGPLCAQGGKPSSDKTCRETAPCLKPGGAGS